MPPSPWMMRRTAKNRVDNQLARTPVANPGRRRSQRLQTRFTHFAHHAANRSPTPGSPGEPPYPWLSDDGVAGRSDCSRRDTRQGVKRFGSGPIGGGGDSPLTHLLARYRHDSSRSCGSDQPPPASSAQARTSRFSAASNPERSPSHTVVDWPMCGHRWDATESRNRSSPRLDPDSCFLIPSESPRQFSLARST